MIIRTHFFMFDKFTWIKFEASMSYNKILNP